MDARARRRSLTNSFDPEPSEGPGTASGPIRRSGPAREYAPPAATLAGGLRRRLRRPGQMAWVVGRRSPHIEPGSGHILLGDVRCSPGVELRCGAGGRVHVADGTQLGQNVFVFAANEVDVGRGVRIAWDVVITDTPGVGRSGRSVSIGDGAWIGAGAVVLGGAAIGAGAIVGAGAVVSGSVPPGAVVPAGASASDDAAR